MRLFLLALLLGSILLSVYIFFFQLGKAPLDNWDEAWHAEMTKEMIQTHNYITPHWNGAVFLDRLPLFLWISSFFTIFFGISETAMRLPSAISGFILSFLVVLHIHRKFGLLPAAAGESTLLLNNIFIWRSRSGNLDTITAFFTFLVYLLLINKSRFRLPLLGFVFALIYLTRGSYVLFPIGISLVYELIFNWKEILKNIKGYLLCILLFLIIPGVWLVLGHMQNGNIFTDFYLFHSDHAVSVVLLKNFSLDYFQYTYYALQRYYIYFFILGLLFLLKKIKDPANFLLILFSTVLLIFLSFAERKNNWYLVPIMPFWSITISYTVYTLLKLTKNNVFTIIFFILFTTYFSYKTFFINIQPVIYTTSAIGEAKSAKYIKAHTSKNDTIVRLDHLFPTFVFYSDRHVFVSPSEDNASEGYSKKRAEIAVMVKNHSVRYLAGQGRDVDFFLQKYPNIPFRKININNDEKVLEAL